MRARWSFFLCCLAPCKPCQTRHSGHAHQVNGAVEIAPLGFHDWETDRVRGEGEVVVRLGLVEVGGDDGGRGAGHYGLLQSWLPQVSVPAFAPAPPVQAPSADAAGSKKSKKGQGERKAEKGKEKAERKVKAVDLGFKLPPKSDLASDGSAATVLDPEVAVPRQARRHGQLPNKKFRADEGILAADRAWWMEGAYNEQGVPLRDGTLGDSVAAAYWNRFLLLVAFVDDSWGVQGVYGSAAEYLTHESISWWLEWLLPQCFFAARFQRAMHS